MSGSTIPAAWSALTALWQSAAPDLQVVKGPNYDPEPDFLAVGWDRSDQAPIQFTPAPMGTSIGHRTIETFELSSLLSFSYDASTVDQVIVDLFAAYRLLEAAIRADPKLGGVVVKATVTAGDVTPVLTEGGTVMDLRFTTQIEAVN